MPPVADGLHFEEDTGRDFTNDFSSHVVRASVFTSDGASLRRGSAASNFGVVEGRPFGVE